MYFFAMCLCELLYSNSGLPPQYFVFRLVVYILFIQCSAPAGINSVTEAVNTFTIRHPSVEISTTSVRICNFINYLCVLYCTVCWGILKTFINVSKGGIPVHKK